MLAGGRLLSRWENRGSHISPIFAQIYFYSNLQLATQRIGRNNCKFWQADDYHGGREQRQTRDVKSEWEKSLHGKKGWKAKKGWSESQTSTVSQMLHHTRGNTFSMEPKQEYWNPLLICWSLLEGAQSELGDETLGWCWWWGGWVVLGVARVSYVKLDQGGTGCGDFLCKCGYSLPSLRSKARAPGTHRSRNPF